MLESPQQHNITFPHNKIPGLSLEYDHELNPDFYRETKAKKT